MKVRKVLLLSYLLTFGLLGSWAQELPDVAEIQMSVLPGLKFDVPRFQVRPGAKVKLKFRNPDQMIHNFVITAPGAREEVVLAALSLGGEGPAKGYVPDSEKVLWHTKALNPGEVEELSFQAPEVEGVYPYVCTFTGHGFVMYGAMYVTGKSLPPLDSDPNLPPAAVALIDGSDHSHHPLEYPVVSRTFLPDCGPAAIAVGLPRGQSYCFDAGLCQMRYAWSGGFVDNRDHWIGKGEVMSKVVGHIYYRAPAASPLRLGDPGRIPTLRWRGYRLNAGWPELMYSLDGIGVIESARPLRETNGLEFTYTVEGRSEPLFYVIDPRGGADFTSSSGTFKDGVLKIEAKAVHHFTITLTEKPGIEPLAYWSMNDLVFPSKNDPEPGLIGRAFNPAEPELKGRKLDSGLKYSALAKGATLMAWGKRVNSGKTASDPEGGPLFGGGDITLCEWPRSTEAPDGTWHHVALCLNAEEATLFVDGKAQSTLPLVTRPAAEETISIGSAGQKARFRGLLDEVRIYGRVLPPEEIRALYERDITSARK